MTDSHSNDKKFLINNVQNSVPDFITGLLYSNPNLVKIEGYNAVIRKDIEDVKNNQVTLLSGGGSGHEPAHAGYIGDGMLSGAVLGNIFASPSVASILAAIRAVGGSHGVLLIVKNYTGDRLNFGMAMEIAKQEGLQCSMVIVDDDCALQPGKGITGGRGIAGTVLVHKIAGAAAKLGYSLEAIHELAVKTVKSMKTLGIALTTCTIPGTAPSMRLAAPQSIEIGMGIHGEPGREKSTLPSENAARHVSSTLVAGVIRALEQHTHQPNSNEKKKAVLLLNNLGALPAIELGIILKETVEAILLHHPQYDIIRIYAAPFMTSLDMNGLSITVLSVVNQFNHQLVPLLDYPTSAPAWASAMNHSYRPDDFNLQNRTLPYSHGGKLNSLSSLAVIHGTNAITVDRSILQLTLSVSTAIIANEPTLTSYDQICGDGDCGLVLRKGGEKVKELIEELLQKEEKKEIDLTSINVIVFLNLIADTISASMGGTSGALLELFFRAMSNYLSDKYRGVKGSDPSNITVVKRDWIEAYEKGIAAIKFYGGAEQGMRTMLDALIPALHQLQEDENIVKASHKAKEGVEATKFMEGLAGRCNYIDRNLMNNTPDPGAYAIAVAFQVIADTFI